MAAVKLPVPWKCLSRKLVKKTLKKRKLHSVVIQKQYKPLKKLVQKRGKQPNTEHKKALQSLKLKARVQQKHLKPKVELVQLVWLLS